MLFVFVVVVDENKMWSVCVLSLSIWVGNVGFFIEIWIFECFGVCVLDDSICFICFIWELWCVLCYGWRWWCGCIWVSDKLCVFVCVICKLCWSKMWVFLILMWNWVILCWVFFLIFCWCKMFLVRRCVLYSLNIWIVFFSLFFFGCWYFLFKLVFSLWWL